MSTSTAVSQPKRSSLLSFTQKTPAPAPAPAPTTPPAPASTVVALQKQQQLGLLGRSEAQAALYARLQSGILVIKHGRQGAPKRRILQCDSELTALFWMAEPRKRSTTEAGDGSLNSDKSVLLAEVQSVRMGTEIDPAASRIHPHLSASSPTVSYSASPISTSDNLDDGALNLHLAAEGPSPGRKLSNGTETQSVATSVANSNLQGGNKTHKRKSSFFSSNTGNSDSNGVYTGTAILRRNCKPEDLSLCFSLILPTRTFDIQCLDVADFDLLFYNLKEMCSRN